MPALRLDRALARHPDLLAEVDFLLREVVVAVDALDLELGGVRGVAVDARG